MGYDIRCTHITSKVLLLAQDFIVHVHLCAQFLKVFFNNCLIGFQAIIPWMKNNNIRRPIDIDRRRKENLLFEYALVNGTRGVLEIAGFDRRGLLE
jgi:hypothetical protein